MHLFSFPGLIHSRRTYVSHQEKSEKCFTYSLGTIARLFSHAFSSVWQRAHSNSTPFSSTAMHMCSYFCRVVFFACVCMDRKKDCPSRSLARSVWRRRWFSGTFKCHTQTVYIRHITHHLGINTLRDTMRPCDNFNKERKRGNVKKHDEKDSLPSEPYWIVKTKRCTNGVPNEVYTISLFKINTCDSQFSRVMRGIYK
jgi:hypothetical protein